MYSIVNGVKLEINPDWVTQSHETVIDEGCFQVSKRATQVALAASFFKHIKNGHDTQSQCSLRIPPQEEIHNASAPKGQIVMASV